MIPGNHNSKFIIISKAIIFCAIVTGLLKLSLFITSSIPSFSDNILSSTIGPILTLFTTYLFLKLDNKTFSDIDFKFKTSTIKKFFVGILIGGVIMSVFILCFVYSVGFKIQLNKNANILFLLLNALPIIILLAFMEEAIFRGYPFIVVKNELGIVAAILITSVLFGFYHLVFGWGITGFITTSIWGLAFGSLAIFSKGISMPSGFHSSGNLIQLALGTTGSSYSIMNMIDKNGQPVKNLTNNQPVMIAHLILLLFIILSMKWLLKNKNYR